MPSWTVNWQSSMHPANWPNSRRNGSARRWSCPPLCRRLSDRQVEPVMDKISFAIWPVLLDGLFTTLTVSLSALLLGAPLALLLAACGRSGRLPRLASGLYISFWRGTPILVQLLIVFYVLPLLGLDL